MTKETPFTQYNKLIGIKSTGGSRTTKKKSGAVTVFGKKRKVYVGPQGGHYVLINGAKRYLN
jgi:hypothetical protein